MITVNPDRAKARGAGRADRRKIGETRDLEKFERYHIHNEKNKKVLPHTHTRTFEKHGSRARYALHECQCARASGYVWQYVFFP